MARIEKWYKQDLKKSVPVRRMETVFNQDALGHLFGVEVYSDGEAVTLGGSVTGYCLLADGTTVPVSGTRSANRASIVIPQTAYSVIGPITITVKLTEGSAITTLLAVVGIVARSRTGQQVDPGSTITDWTNQISAQLQAVQTAADNLGSTLAAPFSTATDYTAGTYTVNNGNLYRFTVDHPAGAWDASHVVQTNLGQDVCNLNRAIVQFKGDALSTGYDFNTLLTNGIWTVRASRVSACTNNPTGTYGDLKIVVQEMNTNISWQRVFDSTGAEWQRTINSSTGVPVTNWVLHISQVTGTNTAIPMSQKAVTDALATKVGYDQFGTAYIDGQRTVQTNTLTIKSGTNVVQNTNNTYITYKYEINGLTKFKVTGKLKGSSNYMFITATSSNEFVDRQIAGISTETQYTDQEYTVDNPAVKYVYICLYGMSDEYRSEQSVQIQSVKSQYDTEQDANIAKLAAYGNRYIGKKIVCFGDSRTWYDGHAYTDKTKPAIQGETCVGYQQQLRDILGAVVVSQGVSGETSAEICARIRAYDFTGYDAVLLEGGVNDFVKSSTVTIGSIAPIGSTFDTSTVYGAWQSAIEYIATNYPLVKIYMDIPAIAWLGANDDVFPYNVAKIKGEIAELYSLPCKDLYKTSGINKINRDVFYCDDTSLTNNWHLHFNDAGNALIGAELAMFINGN